MSQFDLDNIAYLIENPPDPKTQASTGYTIGEITLRHPQTGAAMRISRRVVPDNIGKPIAKLMEERAKKEYAGKLIIPDMETAAKIAQTGVKIDLEALDKNVVKKDPRLKL